MLRHERRAAEPGNGAISARNHGLWRIAPGGAGCRAQPRPQAEAFATYDL